jgi:hypothetical protein
VFGGAEEARKRQRDLNAWELDFMASEWLRRNDRSLMVAPKRQEKGNV